MENEDLKQPSGDIIRQTEDYVRQNPLPTLLGALAVGFAVGIIARSLEKPRQPEPLSDAVSEIRSLLKPFAKKTRRAYTDSSEAVREAVDQVLEKAQDIDVTPVTGWWKRLWS